MAQDKPFVALAGNIGSGKTTAAKIISNALGFELFDEPVIDNRFLRLYYEDMLRWSFTLQMEFLIKRVDHHRLIETVDKPCIQDRTLLEDPEIFAKYLHGLGKMTDKEIDLYFDYYRAMTRDIRHPTKIIYLHVPEEHVLLSRIQHRGRREEANLSRDFLRGLNAYYQTFPQVCREKYELDVMEIPVTAEDIRTDDGRQRFLERVEKFILG